MTAGTFTCPNGHQSASSDYCDTCGVPVPEGAPAAATPAPAGGEPPPTALDLPTPQKCPNCGSQASAAALFCEACGYDFTTGTMPRPPDPTPAPEKPSPAAPEPLATQIPLEWVAELWVDPDWYAAQQSEDPCPSPGLPV
ncbi:MAG: zinc ribbon domain-containing protein, partial [Marmoricola sp.]